MIGYIPPSNDPESLIKKPTNAFLTGVGIVLILFGIAAGLIILDIQKTEKERDELVGLMKFADTNNIAINYAIAVTDYIPEGR